MLPGQAREFAEELRQIFADLGRSDVDPVGGECSPPLDVYEAGNAIEVRMDLPGVPADLVRVVIKGGAILIAGEKPPRRTRGDSSFHLVERGFGRFARTLQLPAPCDGAQAQATLRDGELRITLPRITDRRGRAIRVPVS